MTDGPAAYRRLCLMVDVESYSRQTNQRQFAIQGSLAEILAGALRRAGVRPGQCERQEQGDGFLLLLPSGVDEGRTIPGLINGFAEGLATANQDEPERIRLRAALTQGAVRRAATGYVANAIVTAARLVSSAELRQALARYPDRDLALAVTSDLYDDVVADGFTPTADTDLLRAHVRLPDKGFSADVRILVPVSPAVGTAHPRPRRGSVFSVAGVALPVIGLGGAAIHPFSPDEDSDQVDTGPLSAPVPDAAMPAHEVTSWPDVSHPDLAPGHPAADYEVTFGEPDHPWDAGTAVNDLRPWPDGSDHVVPGDHVNADPHTYGLADGWPDAGSDPDGGFGTGHYF